MGGFEEPCSGSPSTLFMESTQVGFPAKVIPPPRVVEDFFKRGIMDHGMSGTWIWSPYTMSKPEMAAFRADLKKKGYKTIPVPSEIQSFSHLSAWLLEDHLKEDGLASTLMLHDEAQANIQHLSEAGRDSEAEAVSIENMLRLNAMFEQIRKKR